jgi:DNA repair exonuclease SbcCD nuclease subunit
MAKPLDFSKCAVFGDIHYGRRNNNQEHNTSCESFIKWMIERCEEHGIRTCIFLGDYHHVRSSINISTLNYSVRGLKLLNNYFDNTVFIIGNHDLFYRNKYELHSLPYIEQFPKIIGVERMLEIDGVAFVPWLVQDDWKKVPDLKSPFMFGHFELPKFKMNSMVEMPDHGMLNATHFVHQRQVFSGHFHKRQNKQKIWYTGNTFPHDFSDAWDDERGMMIWTPDQVPQFLSWPDAPKYRTLTMSQVVEDPFKYIDHRTFAKISVDVAMSYEDQHFIKNLLEKEIGAREIQIHVPKMDNPDMLDEGDINFESVDNIVISHLQSIESNTIDCSELVRIYERL